MQGNILHFVLTDRQEYTVGNLPLTALLMITHPIIPSDLKISSSTHPISDSISVAITPSLPSPTFKKLLPKSFHPNKSHNLISTNSQCTNHTITAPTIFKYQRKNKRLTSKANLDVDITAHKLKVVIDEAVDMPELVRKGVPCGSVSDYGSVNLKKVDRSRVNPGRIGHGRRGGRPGTQSLSSSFNSVENLWGLHFDQFALSPNNSSVVLVKLSYDNSSKVEVDALELDGPSSIQGGGGWLTATRSQ
ncbi:hypothetical protein M0R45_002310 [Rubus argutus]|uniref:Uncharacterized protein n=1 Tax=Rubus argutus TaxID=59490 RepID=A0AAW1VD91_RUBAR